MVSPALGQSLNTTRYIAETPYYIADAKTHSGLENDDVTGPCTVIPYDDSPTTDYVRDVIATFTSDDDVWSSAFLDTVVFAGSPRNAQPAEDFVDFLSQRGTRNIIFRLGCTANHRLSWGPYWLENTALHKVFRLYSDDIDAFVMSTVPSAESRFE